MAVLNSDELLRAIKSGKRAACWLIFSQDAYLLESAARTLINALCEEEGEEPTVLPGPVPSIGEAVEAAGAISMFGNRRVVLFRNIEPVQMPAADIKLLAELCEELESAYLVFTILVKDNAPHYGRPDPVKLPAAAKALQAAVEKHGVVAALEKPNEGTARAKVCAWAKQMGAECSRDAAEELVNRCGINMMQLRAETDKLAAASDYGVITVDLVRMLSVRNIEADVFELSKHILSGRADRAFTLLDELIYLQNEPIMISAALSGTYLDMYRVKCGQDARIGYAQVFRDLGYKGKDYRLKKSGEAAAGYTSAQLAECLEVLANLDKKLKGSSMDKNQLLQMAVGQLLLCGKNRRKNAYQ